jgi:hypothetical protein
MSLPTQSFEAMLWQEELEERAEFVEWNVEITITISIPIE